MLLCQCFAGQPQRAQFRTALGCRSFSVGQICPNFLDLIMLGQVLMGHHIQFLPQLGKRFLFFLQLCLQRRLILSQRINLQRQNLQFFFGRCGIKLLQRC